MKKKIKCPTCKKRFFYDPKDETQSKNFPFCSERCKYADLDKWLKEEYRISEPLQKKPPEKKSQ